MIVVSDSRHLEHTPGLVDLDPTDDVGNPRTAKVVVAVGGTDEGVMDVIKPPQGTQVKQIALMVGGRIDKRQGARHAVAELSVVRQLVDGGDVAAAADETVEVVARIVGPRSVERGNRLTHREPSELDERMVDADRAASDTTVRGVSNGRCAAVNGGARERRVSGVRTRGPRERRIEERADHAVFGRGARIDGQILTGTSGVIVRQAVLSAQLCGVRTVEHRSVESSFNAQITTQLDAGVGAGDVVETRTIQGADPHVLDRFGLDGKVRSLCPTHGDQSRR